MEKKMSVKGTLSKQLKNPTISNRVYYEITSVCNLKCIHCSDLLHASSTFLPSGKILRFHREMKRLGINSSVITGGEPAIHEEFDVIVTGLSAIGPVLITSNGTLIDPEQISWLLKLNPNVTLQISMDGISKSVFEEIRGANTFDKVVSLIDFLLLRDLKKQLGISMTILRQNVNQVIEMIDFARERKLSFIHFPSLLPVGIAMKRWEEVSPTVEQQIWAEEQILKEMTDNTYKTNISSNRIEQILTRISNGAKGDCLGNCTLKVTPEGFILPCPASSNVNLRLGSIDEEGIVDSLIERLGAKINDYLSLIGPELLKCSECEGFNYCFARFCANCMLLNSSNHLAEYDCAIIRHHLMNVIKEINDEKPQ
jgi:radical SAM protein with 4Fe4S-binding SPASM domain